MENQLSKGDQFLAVVTQTIEDNIGNESFSVAVLANEVGLSRSMMHRKLIRLTGKSATDLITETRLSRALELLENDVATVSEIAYRVGFSSPSYFTKVFKKTYSMSPGEVRQKGSGKYSHLTVVKEPGNQGSARSKRSKSYVIAGINILMIISVGIGAASFIQGLENNAYPFSRLPEWAMTLIIVLLGVVFVISVFLSWTYDLNLVKTKPAIKVKTGEKHPPTNRWKIPSYFSFVAIVAFILLNIIPRENREGAIEKSIAVLPFWNDGPDQENDHIINGTMESILWNLSKISRLKVIPRTSVERYRNSLKSIPEICSELNVGFALVGSMQKYGDQIRLNIQLVDKNDNHLWSEQYERPIINADQYYTLYSEIALLVADEIDVILTPEEKQLIEKIQTTDLTAWDFYNRGTEELMKFRLGNKNNMAVIRAKTYFEKALKYDKDFARAYIGLGDVYWIQHYWPEYYQDNFLDSCLILANKALSIDNYLEEAFTLRGSYFAQRGDNSTAIAEFENALTINSDSWQAHWQLARLYHNNDILLALEHSIKTIQLYRGPLLASMLDYISDTYLMVGCIDQGVHYMNEILKLENDSAEFYLSMAGIGTITSNYEMALEYGLKAFQFDSTKYFVTEKIASSYFFLRQYEDAIRYWLKPYAHIPSDEIMLSNFDFRLSVAYWETGNQEEALISIDSYKNHCIKTIELGRRDASQYYSVYDLAGIYCFFGETEKAYENLRVFDQKERIPLWWATLIKDDPLFDSIRDEPEFQKIVRNVDAKYQAEYERVRQWLEENDML